MFLCETAVEWTGKKSVQYFKRFHFDWGKRIEVEKGYQASNKDHIKVVMSAPAEAAGSSEMTILKVDRPLGEYQGISNIYITLS